MSVSIIGDMGEFEVAIRRAQVTIWRWIIRAYKKGYITNAELERHLLDILDGGAFAKWFFAGGVSKNL